MTTKLSLIPHRTQKQSNGINNRCTAASHRNKRMSADYGPIPTVWVVFPSPRIIYETGHAVHDIPQDQCRANITPWMSAEGLMCQHTSTCVAVAPFFLKDLDLSGEILNEAKRALYVSRPSSRARSKCGIDNDGKIHSESRGFSRYADMSMEPEWDTLPTTAMSAGCGSPMFRRHGETARRTQLQSSSQ